MFDLGIEQVRQVVRELDPARLSGPDAVRLMEGFAELERLAAAGKSLVAARAVDANQWRGVDRAPEFWLARTTGISVGAARETLETAERMQALPAVEAAVRDGKLSTPQAALVSRAAHADPDAEQQLLDAAGRESLTELRRRAERVIAAKRSADDEREREDAIRRTRDVRVVDLADGAAELRARGTRTDIAMLRAHLQPWIDEQFEQARKQDRRDPLGAYAFDGLMAMATTPRGEGKLKSPAKVLVRVDLAAVRRGTTEPGEICEIAGYGPIPVSEALKLMPEAFLALIVTNGKQVINVTHLGRKFTEHQQTALQWISPECSVLGCSATVRLEKDHRADWAKTKRTTIDEADHYCGFHHGLKTKFGYHLEPGTGKRRLLPPERAPAKAA